MLDPNDKRKFLELLQELPNVSVVAKRVGISKATIYRWRKEDETFKKAMAKVLKIGRENINDLAESKLISAIHKGERWAIQTWLEFNDDRYYKPRKARLIETGYKGVTEMNIYVHEGSKVQVTGPKPPDKAAS